jgi:hypothetical protein
MLLLLLELSGKHQVNWERRQAMRMILVQIKRYASSAETGFAIQAGRMFFSEARKLLSAQT